MNMDGRTAAEAEKQFTSALIKAGFVELAKREENATDSWLGEHENMELAQTAFEVNRRGSYRDLSRAIRRKAIRKTLFQTVPRVGKMAVFVLFLFYVSLTIAVATVDQVREGLYRFLVNTEDAYSELTLHREEIVNSSVPSEWKGIYYPLYIPVGLELNGFEQSIYSSNQKVIYKSPDGSRWLVYAECKEDEKTLINTEDSVVTWEDVNGIACMFVDRGTEKYVTWSSEDRYFFIWTDGACNELRKIVENVKITVFYK